MKRQDAEEFKGHPLGDTMRYMKRTTVYIAYFREILALSIGVIYLFCMVLYPTLNNWNAPDTWQKVQNVWDRWQTFNSAVIALLASVIAFKATTYQYHRERENNLRAAKCKLPQALSDICSYTKACAQIHHGYYAAIMQKSDRRYIPAPAIPTEAVASIVEFVRYSPVEVGNYLSKILESLQVIHARLEPDTPGLIHVPIAKNELSNINYIALTYTRAEHLLSYARNEEPFSLADESNETIKRIIRLRFGFLQLTDA